MPPCTWKTPTAATGHRTRAPVTHRPRIGRIAGSECTEYPADVARDAPVGVFVVEGEATCESD